MVTCCGCLGCCCGCLCICGLCASLKPKNATIILILLCVIRYFFVNSDFYQQFTLENSLKSIDLTASSSLSINNSVWKAVVWVVFAGISVQNLPLHRQRRAVIRSGCWLLFLYEYEWGNGLREWTGEVTCYWVWIVMQYIFLAKTWEEVKSSQPLHILLVPSYFLAAYVYLHYSSLFPSLPSLSSVWELACLLFSLFIRYTGVWFAYQIAAILALAAQNYLSPLRDPTGTRTHPYRHSLNGATALCILASIVVWLDIVSWLYEVLDLESPWVLTAVEPLTVTVVAAACTLELSKEAVAGQIVAILLSIEVWKVLLAAWTKEIA